MFVVGPSAASVESIERSRAASLADRGKHELVPQQTDATEDTGQQAEAVGRKQSQVSHPRGEVQKRGCPCAG